MHALERIHQSGQVFGFQPRRENPYWDSRNARRAQARTLRAARRTLSRHELMLGLAVFIANTNERPPIDDVKAAFVGHSPARVAKTKYADIQDLL